MRSTHAQGPVDDDLGLEDLDRGVDDELSEEWRAILDGSYVEHLQDAGADIPPWAWINQAAHADVETLERIAARAVEPTLTGESARTLLARAILAAAPRDEVPALQREVVAPIEAELMGSVVTPRRILELVASAVYA